MTWALVGIGGMLGALARYGAGLGLSRIRGAAFPVATMLVNFSGAFLLGLLAKSTLPNQAVLLLGDGFLGAYTTFSTFMWEGFVLFKNKRHSDALLYVALTMAGGIAAFALAYFL